MPPTFPETTRPKKIGGKNYNQTPAKGKGTNPWPGFGPTLIQKSRGNF